MSASGSAFQDQEARVGPRVNVRWRARLLTGPQGWLDAKVVNISADGMAVECEHAFASGVSLTLVVSAPDARDRSVFRTLQLQVRTVFHVHRGHSFRTGLRIEQADDEARGLIEHWVRNG